MVEKYIKFPISELKLLLKILLVIVILNVYDLKIATRYVKIYFF